MEEVTVQEPVKVETEADAENQDTASVAESQETTDLDNTTVKTGDEKIVKEDEKEEIVSPSNANKAEAQASEQANENAIEHAADNSAVVTGQVAIEETTTEEVAMNASLIVGHY
ncbi:hypothetical protein [Ammoniphilus resinae]|uniref:Membrane protein n=1 Tax=Ammoniphilus resinae TaxID=861532 RepID=A0ABS4GXH6_9BACL|nr:hypothetical protein [Ammoniphilus resinae]MBP1934967.1 putative membrane protein [Ammoniphilus resinae]